SASTAANLVTVDLSSVASDTSGSLPFSSLAATATLPVKPDNDAPVLTLPTVALTPLHEDAGSGLPGEPADPGFQISSVANGLAGDIQLKAEAAALGIAVTGVTQTANGSWQVSFNGGVNWTTIDPTSIGLTQALLLDGSDDLRFLPNKEWSGVGTSAPALTFYAWDQTYDAITGKIDAASTATNLVKVDLSSVASDTSGSLPFSASSAVATLPVQPDNDAPTLSSSTLTLTAIGEDAGSGLKGELPDPGFQISSAAAGFGGVITLKAEDAKLGVAVTGVTQTTNGQWQVSFDGGQTWPMTIGSSTTLSNALLLDGSDYIRFLPNKEWSGTGASAPTISLLAWDQTYDAITGKIDLASTAAAPVTVDLSSVASDTSGSLPFSSTSLTANLAVKPDNDAPTLSATKIALTAIPEDAGSGLPGEVADPGFQISSATSGLRGYITVKSEGGSLGIAITGVTQTANGQWQVSFDGGQTWPTTIDPATSIQTAVLLDGSDYLRFLPNKEWSGTGTNAPSFTFYAWDQTYDTITGKTDAASTSAALTTVNLSSVAGDTSGSLPFSAQAAQVTLPVTPDNDAPVLKSQAVLLTAIPEDAGSGLKGEAPDPGFAISTALASDITLKAGSAAKLGIAVAGLTQTTNGQWQVSFNNGANWTTINPATSISTALLLDGSDLLRFLPNPEFSGTGVNAPALTFYAWDQTYDAITGTTDAASTATNLVTVNLSSVASDTSGSLPFSAVSAVASLPVTPDNDAPVLLATSGVSFQTIAEDLPKASNAGSTVLQMLESLSGGAKQPSDVVNLQTKAQGGQYGIAVTQVTQFNNGQWQYSLDGGNTWTGFSAALDAPAAGSAALLLDSSDLVRFLPNLNFNSTAANQAVWGPAPALSFVAWDETYDAFTGQTSDAAGSTVDLTKSGTAGSTPFSDLTKQAVATLAVTAVDDAPVVTTAKTSFTTQEPVTPADTSQNIVISGITVSDVDAIEASTGLNTQEKLSVSIPAGAGSLTIGGQTGTNIVLTDTLANLNADLAGLTFAPATESAELTPVTLNVTIDDLGNFGSLPLGATSLTAQAPITINIIKIHHAPILTGTPQTQQVAEKVHPSDTQVNPGVQISSLLTGNEALDTDENAQYGIAVTGVTLDSPVSGVWQYSADGGNTWTNIVASSVSTSSALLLPGNDLIRFASDAGTAGNAHLQFVAWDQTDGSAAGSTINLSSSGTTGGTTAYSGTSSTITWQVIELRDHR
ncbi:MAG TPA: hypothetical protein VJ783_16925, partial [Pirellulales bacterium]|nr:hypothetical protein [Pirellulales bacterium]